MKADTKQETSETASWSTPKQSPEVKGDAALQERWKAATDAIAVIAAQNGWNKSEVARRADMAIGTFSGWYDGTYKGRYDVTTLKVENLLSQAREEAEARAALPVEPAFIQSRVARELFEIFTYAQMMPTIGIATVGSGLGKTKAAEAYKSTRPHVHLITLCPTIRTPHKINQAIASVLKLSTNNSATLNGHITDALKGDGYSALLIFDEAQNLNDECINEIRHYRDNAKCGIVLLGNEEGKTPYSISSTVNDTSKSTWCSAQVRRRVGCRLTALKPYPEDIDTFLDAWGLSDQNVREMARKVSQRAGAFGTLTETLRMASMIAKGRGEAVSAGDIQAGFRARGESELV